MNHCLVYPSDNRERKYKNSVKNKNYKCTSLFFNYQYKLLSGQDYIIMNLLIYYQKKEKKKTWLLKSSLRYCHAHTSILIDLPPHPSQK